MNLLPYNGYISLSGSKSILQRILLLAALEPMNIILYPASRCEDVKELTEAIISRCGSVRFVGDYLHIITSAGTSPEQVKHTVRFTGSATALRFWLAYSAVKKDKSEIMISPQLANRPHNPLFSALTELGADLHYYLMEMQLKREKRKAVKVYKSFDPAGREKQIAKIKMNVKRPYPDEITIDSSLSSQYTSALMIAGSRLPRGLKIHLEGKPVSSAYAEMTKQLLLEFGVSIKTTSKSITLPAKRPLKTMHQFVVEPDMSSAAFFLCLGAFSAKGIGMECKAKTRWQPDWIITSILSRMGVSILEQGNSLTAKSGSLHGIEQDLSSNPDLLPLLAILALFADSPSVFTGIAHLKFKESDRLKGMKKALTAIGANFEMTPESLKISPLQAAPPETKLNTQHDHRLVMAFTLIKLHYPQITLSETESVSKSCPEFFALLAKLK